MYKRLNLLGNDYSTMVSQAYTVADIVLPIIRDKKKGVIVTAGLEEHLYPYLARVSIERLKQKSGGLNNLVDKDANLGDTSEELYEKIVQCGRRNEEVILQMMILASNWNHSEILNAKSAFENRENDYSKWLNYKEKYYKFFLGIKKLWDDSKEKNKIDTYNELFK